MQGDVHVHRPWRRRVNPTGRGTMPQEEELQVTQAQAMRPPRPGQLPGISSGA